MAILKLKHLLSYCKINSINLEATKSHFICVNGTDADRVPLPTTGGDIKNSSHIDLLGSHLSESGSVAADLQLHYDARFTTCIKFYNFLKSLVNIEGVGSQIVYLGILFSFPIPPNIVCNILVFKLWF